VEPDVSDAKGIDLGIVVTDGDAAVRFYTEVLGLKLEGSNPVGNGTMHRVRCGSSMLKLIATDTPPAAPTKGELMGVGGYRYLTITVDDVDAAVARCEAAGHPAVMGPRDMGPARIAMVEDPDGNRVEFLHLP
jgi:catechol 2,3-dioxygenase-like lactoylglutathione lyase family enzyme